MLMTQNASIPSRFAPYASQDESKSRLDQILDRLKAAGHRITPQRLAILNILVRDAGHPSVESIYEQLAPKHPTMSLATVYKTIVLLKQLGEITEIRLGMFGVRYDGQTSAAHPHVVCTRCGEVLHTGVSMDGLVAEVAKDTGCELIDHNLVFYGVCGTCRRKCHASS